MNVFRRLGRSVERFRQFALAAAEDSAADRPDIRCGACEAWIPTRYDRCPACGRLSPRAVLEVPEDASAEVVQAAAREQLKAVHPDHGGSPDAFRRVKEARDRLLSDLESE